MTARLPAALVVAALLRRTNDAGGTGVLLARGDPQAGAILVVITPRDAPPRVLERGIGADGETCLIESHSGEGACEYWQRRRRGDPDVWVVELDSPHAERFAAETMLVN